MAIVFESYSTGEDAQTGSYAAHFIAQSFTPQLTHELTKVELRVRRLGTISNVTVGIFATASNLPSGSALVSKAIDGSGWSDSSFIWGVWTFDTQITLTAGVEYAIVIDGTGYDSGNAPLWRQDSTGTYTRGTSSIEDPTWRTLAYDFYFKEYGDRKSLPVDKVYSKELIAIANDELWYESSAGTMAELSAANGDINTDNPLEAVEAFQKLFIVNKTNLKIYDPSNTKINTADAGAVVCHKGNTLTGGTSGAKMVIDYVDAITDDSAMNVYGYRYTTATFSSGETVTGTNDDGDTISFDTSAAETAPPHWYDWTVFGNDTTNYGTLPTSATLIALYRGRIIVNDNYNPHAWKMMKVGNPFKALYDLTNDGDLSAVSHTNNKVGIIGDILTAYISYKDDLFIFGCANSIWALIGDPLASGQLAEITNATGIWGSRAWCFDGESNLYFLGEHGIYRMSVGETVGPPENLSKLRLPNLISDLDLDKSLHRVVFGFDPENHGIIISKTTLDGGANTNYFFSLFTQGFYPETYPDSCGIFSAFYYPATDDTYKKYLVGCTDGYIREFDLSTKNDATTSSTSAIDSYFTVTGQLGNDEDYDGKLNWLTAITSGGASGGDFSDTDSVSYSLYGDADAETVLEKMKAESAWATGTVYAIGDLVVYSSVEYRCITAHTSDAGGPPYEEPDTNTTDWLATQFATGTWTGVGKHAKARVRMRNSWYGLKIRNNTASETWGLNKLYADRLEAGRIKG